MHALLIGNYGVGNLGDEMLREYFLRRFPDAAWTVVTARPRIADDVPRLPLGIRSFFAPWWRTLRAVKTCDAVVFGGGSLFTDAESLFACFLWGWHAWIAHRMGKPLFLAFQGIGPFRTRLGKGIARWVLRHTRFLSVRDEESHRRAREFLGESTRIVQSSDPAILSLRSDKSADQTQKVFSIIPRENSSESFRVRAGEAWRRGAFAATVILSLRPDDPREREVCRLLRRSLVGSRVQEVRTAEALTEAVARSSFVLSQRYHGALAALALGISFDVVPQQEGDKLAALVSAGAGEELRERALRGEEALREALTDCVMK